VANFLGQSNLLAAEVVTRGTSVEVTAYGRRFSVPAGRCRAAGSAAYLGVRPEKLHLAAAAADVPAGHQSVSGVVTDSSFVGVSNRYLVRAPWGTELAVFAPNTGIADPVPLGGEVIAHWDPRHAFLLDREPGAGDATSAVEPEPTGVPA
jgi:spermidine/putrescine transport system ATP-binding protein